MVVIHVVSMRFKPHCSPEAIEAALQRSWALKDKCVHPTTRQPYICSIVSGRNLDIVPNQFGFTHSTKIEFENAEDCRYFIKEDPEHKELYPVFHAITEEIMVMDYTPGLLSLE